MGLFRAAPPAAMSRDFIQNEPEQPNVLLMCTNMSLLRNLWHIGGIHARLLKPSLPFRVPGIDIPEGWREDSLPVEIAVKAKGGDK